MTVVTGTPVSTSSVIMNVGTAGFESCIRAPSPAPGLPPMPSFGMPTHISVAHPAQVLPTSNIESFESSTVYSRPYSIDSAGSRTVRTTVLRHFG